MKNESKKEILNRSPQRLLLILSLLLITSLSFLIHADERFSEAITQVQLTSCNAKSCIKLTTATAARGPMSGLFAFAKSQVEVTPKSKGQRAVRLQADDGYYDPQLDIIVLRQIPAKDWSEATISTASDEITFYR